MKNYLYIFIFAFVHVNQSHCKLYKFNENLDHYLTKLEIDKMYNTKGHNIFKKDTEKILIDLVSTTPIPYNNSEEIFKMFGETFIFNGQNFSFLTEDKENSYMLEPSNLNLSDSTRKGDFLKTVIYGDAGFLLVSYIKDNEVNLYRMEQNSTKHINHLQAIEIVAVDAHFFVNHNKLYLALLNKSGVLKIYEYEEFYFDEIESAVVVDPAKLSSFTDKHSEILIILSEQKRCTLFEFNLNTLRKVEKLFIANATYITPYYYENMTFVMIGNNTYSKIYYWNDYYLVDWIGSYENLMPGKYEIFYNNTQPILLNIRNDSILAYCPRDNKIELLNNNGYKSNFSRILEVEHHKEETKKTESDLQENDVLQQCFINLEQKLYTNHKKLNNLREDMNAGLLQNETIPSPRITRSNAFVSRSANPETQTFEDMMKVVDDFKQTVDEFKSSLENNSIVINERMVINGSLNARTLLVKNLIMNNLNGKKWEPQEWLLYSVPQVIRGPVHMAKLRATNVETTKEFLGDVLLADSSQQVLTGPIRVRNLTTTKLYLNEINGIKFDDVYVKSKPTIITGLKHFQRLNASEIRTETFNNNEPGEILSYFTDSQISNVKFSPNVFVDDLIIKNVNNVNWEDFLNSVYRIGITDAIKGNLTFLDFKTENLSLKSLNNISTDNLFTTSTDQEIQADIEFKHIFTKDIAANSVNGIRLKEEAALVNSTIIEGPVKMDKLIVNNDLEIIGDFDKSFLLKDGDHVIGTNESDLLQIYNKKVVIKGNLFVNNFTLYPEGKMRLGDEFFSNDIPSKYWTKNTNQEIPVHFEALNGISATHLITKQINEIKVPDFMLNNNEEKAPTNYYFENVTVLGNIVLDKNQLHTPDLAKIDREAVKTTGSFFVRGAKTYNDTLRAKNFITNNLAGINVLNAVTNKSPANITGKKIFKNVIVKGNANVNWTSINVLNNVLLSKLEENTLFIDRVEVVDELKLSNMKTDKLEAKAINNVNVKRHISQMENLFEGDIEELYITGNVSINNVDKVESLNNINITKLLSNDLKVTKAGTIKGIVKFSGLTKVKNLDVTVINDIDFENLTSRILYRNISQQITAPYTFTRVKASNIYVDVINNRNVSNLIDISAAEEQSLYAPKSVKFLSPVQMLSMYTDKTNPCSLDDGYMKLRHPQVKELNKLQVNGNVTFLDEDYGLADVLKNAVTLNSENVITAPVKLRSFSADEMDTKKLLNNVNVQELFDDALLSDSEEEQVVTGFNSFSGLFANNAEVKGKTNVPKVNGIFVSALNKSIVDKNDANDILIRGKKTFYGGLQTDKFNSELVSNMKPSELVTTGSTKPIPVAIFDSLNILNDININFVNNVDLNLTLNNRLLCHSEKQQIANGTYFFENVNILNNLRVNSINNINVNDIVFDVGEQIVHSPKKFKEHVIIEGNVDIELLNEINITEKHNEAILKGQNANFENSVAVLRPAEIEGNIETETLNGYSISTIKEVLEQGAAKIEANFIHSITKEIDISVRKILPLAKTIQPEFMYIEKSMMLQVSFPNTTNAKIVTTNDGHVLLHIIGEEQGAFCGLPNDCLCPIQHTVEISTENSINDFVNKGYQRIFSYNDDDMTVHFITNSISTDLKCRTNNSNDKVEQSHITWSTTTTPKQIGSFFIYDRTINGYISGVEYFTAKGFTYVLYGRYYEPAFNSHELNCVLLKFNRDKTRLHEVQQIPANFLWTLHTFVTPRGVELIFGSIQPNPTDPTDTAIYRFNEIGEKFEMVEKIASDGCTSAVGVVLGEDSFVALANKYDSIPDLKIYKYSKYTDHYHYYQSIRFNSPILSTTVFYTGGLGSSDAFMCIVNEYNFFYIYTYNYLEGWKLQSNGEMDGLKSLIPFNLNDKQYLFASSAHNSSLLSVVKYGVN